MSPALNQPVQRWERWALTALLACYAGLLGYLAWRVGVTIDEPSHLLSACLYWQGEDNLQPRDMPPLIKIASGWVPAAFFGLPIPHDRKDIMETRHEWFISGEMMGRMKAGQIRSLYFWSRLPMIVFPILATLLTWWWGRQLFAPAVGLILAILYMLEPTATGHGALVKNDVAATVAYLWFWYRGWRFWKEPQLRNAAWLGAALLAGLLAKISLMILPPLAFLVVVARCARRPWQWRRTVAALSLVLLVPYVGSLAACQFETRRLSGEVVADYQQKPHIPALVRPVLHVFRVLPLPMPLWEGALAVLQSNAGENSVYLLGELYPRGHPLYFLVALAVKVPVTLQILFLGGLAVLLRRHWRAEDLFWIAPGFLYVGFASLSSLELGLRLILPALPFGLLIAGCCIHRLWKGRLRLVPVLLIAWLGARNAVIFPHYISFFNRLSGGPDNGLKYLSGSNLDWGQDLRELRPVLARHGIDRIRVSYFGACPVWVWLDENRMEIIPPPWEPRWARGTQLQPEPGYYAISATLLTGQFFSPEYRDYYSAFRPLKPVAKAGYSIFIYRIP